MKKIFAHKLFIIGLLIRFIVMPFAGHFDIRGINFGVYNLPYNHALNVYDNVEKSPVDYIVNVNFGREYFVYPPLTYFTLGSFMYLLKPLYGPNFASWISGNGNNINWVLEHDNVFRYLFLMKIPYLVFDVGILALLFHLFKNRVDKNRLYFLWWLNPMSIFLIYLWGQFDVIPAYFTLLSLSLAINKKVLQSALALGIAAAFKNYPLMLLPILAVVSAKNIKTFFQTIVAGLAPYLISIIPFVRSEFFRDTVLISRHSQKLMDFRITIGGNDGLYPFFVGYTLIFFISAYLIKGKLSKLYVPYISVLLWYYSTVNFHHQWFLWIIPFLVYAVMIHKELSLLFVWIIFLFFFRLAVIQADVTFELFAWISSSFNDIPKTRAILGQIYDIDRLRGIVNSLYMGSSLFLIPYLWQKAKRI